MMAKNVYTRTRKNQFSFFFYPSPNLFDRTSVELSRNEIRIDFSFSPLSSIARIVHFPRGTLVFYPVSFA